MKASGLMKKIYIDTAYGQLHAALHPSRASATQPALICLHPVPYSGVYFDSFIPAVNEHRTVIAPDYPGYGGSDSCGPAPSIAAYAEAVRTVVASLAPDGAVDLLGFHSGALVAAEFSLRYPEQSRRLVLIDVPCFDTAQQGRMLEKIGEGLALSAELDCLAPAWQANISDRLGDMPLARAFQLFMAQLSSGSADHSGYVAAFRYPCHERMAQLDHPTLVIATNSMLYETSVQASRIIPGSALRELPSIRRSVFETGISEVAAAVNTFLQR